MTKLEKAAHEHACENYNLLEETLAAVKSFKKGAEWREANLWHDAQGDDLPEIDREVIVLCNNGKVCFGHRPDPNGWDGKNILTGEVTHYTPQTYDKGGWNFPDIKWWLDVNIPKEE